MGEHGVVSKWLLASGAHKSIRRGHVDLAREYATRLLQMNASYLMFRLGTIALEEVGPGDWNLVGEVLEKIRDGKSEALPTLAARLAEATKSRSVVYAKRLPPGDIVGLDPLLRFIAVYGAGFEKLGLAVPHVAQLVGDSESTSMVIHPPDEFGDEMIGEYSAATFDQHVREGKRAIAYFTSMLKTEFTFDQVAWAVFVVEGQHIDKELLFDGSDALRVESTEAGFHKRGITSRDQMLDLTQLIHESRALLNGARRRVTRCPQFPKHS
jgi:hypothetical protein